MTDAELIDHLGGPTKVAELLKFDKQGGVQRVQNWLVRGIPAQVKLDHLELFQVGSSAAPAKIAAMTDHPVTKVTQAGLIERRSFIHRADDRDTNAELDATKAGKGA